jgi:hypothetical protein
MVRIGWVEAPDHDESLAVSLRAVLAHNGTDRPYDELLAALGLGFATVATPDDSLGWWCTYARDARLIETASLYGLRLRELHPAEAASGLVHSAEYAQHFQDSYVPLIAVALEHDQLVIAWRGWPAPRDRFWGVITDIRGQTLFGQTLRSAAQPLPLSRPAHQIYIVEEFRPVEPSALKPAHLFSHVARQARAVWAGNWARCANVETGAAAYRAWQNALRKAAGDETTPLALHFQQYQAARGHAGARSHLASWLRRVEPALAGEQARLAAQWADTCDRVAQRLRAYDSPEAVRGLLDRPDEAECIRQAIDEICEVEATLIEKLQTIQ